MPEKLKRQRRQRAFRESDRCIVPQKLQSKQVERSRVMPVKGRRRGHHAIPIQNRLHPAADTRCWTVWIASPLERKRIPAKRLTTSSRCSPLSCCGMPFAD